MRPGIKRSHDLRREDCRKLEAQFVANGHKSPDCMDDRYVQGRPKYASMRYAECSVFGPELDLSADLKCG